MKLSEMTASEILDKFEFSDAFIEEFKAWCKTKPSVEHKMAGLSSFVYEENPLLKLIPKN